MSEGPSEQVSEQMRAAEHAGKASSVVKANVSGASHSIVILPNVQ